MLGRYGINMTIDASLIRYIREYGFFIIAGILFSTPIIKFAEEKIENNKMALITAVAVPMGYGIIFLWAVSFLILGAHNPFIYFNF